MSGWCAFMQYSHNVMRCIDACYNMISTGTFFSICQTLDKQRRFTRRRLKCSSAFLNNAASILRRSVLYTCCLLQPPFYLCCYEWLNRRFLSHSLKFSYRHTSGACLFQSGQGTRSWYARGTLKNRGQAFTCRSQKGKVSSWLPVYYCLPPNLHYRLLHLWMHKLGAISEKTNAFFTDLFLFWECILSVWIDPDFIVHHPRKEMNNAISL